MKIKKIAKLLGLPVFCFMISVSAPAIANAQEQEAGTSHVAESAADAGSGSQAEGGNSGISAASQHNSSGAAVSSQQNSSGSAATSQQNSSGAEPSSQHNNSGSASAATPPAQGGDAGKNADNDAGGDTDGDSKAYADDSITANSADNNDVSSGASGAAPVSENGEGAPAKAADKDIADGEAADKTLADGKAAGKNIVDDEAADKVTANDKAADRDAANGDTVNGDTVNAADGGSADKDINENAAGETAAADSASQVSAPDQSVRTSAGTSDAPVSLRNSMLLTARLSEARRAPADQTGTVIEVGSGTQYATLKAAVESLSSQTGNNVTIQINSDLTETEVITITSGKTITLIGNGTGSTITLSGNGRFQVDGGSLILGSGKLGSGNLGRENTSAKLTIRDSRATGDVAIRVTNGGSLTLNDGAEVITNNAAGNGRAISVDGSGSGDDSITGGKTSKYTGSGGSVTGGSLYLSNNSEASISGGTYVTSNSKSDGAVVVDGGHVTEISGGTFIGKSVSNYGSSTGTFNGLLARGESSKIDKISGGTFIGSAAALSLNPGACVSEITGGNFFGGSLAENKEPADIISESDITWSSGYAIFNMGTIQKITGGKFTGGTALQNDSQGHIGTIDGSASKHLSFTGKNTTGSGIYLDGTSSIDSISYADIRSSGYYGINNNGKLGKISGSAISSDSWYGLVNSGIIDSITDLTQINSGSIGIWNKAGGTIKNIANTEITANGNYGIYNAGTINSLSYVGAQATGFAGGLSYAGLYNTGTIDKTDNSVFQAAVWGIFNSSTGTMKAITNTAANATGTDNYDYRSRVYGLGNYGTINNIKGGRYEGGSGLGNFGSIGAIAGTDADHPIIFKGNDAEGYKYSDQIGNGILIGANKSGTLAVMIGSIEYADLTGTRAGLALLPSTGKGDVKLGKLSHSNLKGGQYGLNNGDRARIEDGIFACRIEGGQTGINNDVGSYIKTISNVTASSTGTAKDYDDNNRKNLWFYASNSGGLYNYLGTIDLIENSTFTSTGVYGIINGPDVDKLYSTIGKILGVRASSTAEGTSESAYGSTSYGLYNGGTINTIGAYKTAEGDTVRSFFKGNYAGLGNIAAYGEKVSIGKIDDSTFEGDVFGAFNWDVDGTNQAFINTIGDRNVFYGTGSGSYGYYNYTGNKTAIEPGLTNSGKAIGTGRYRGAVAGIASADPQKGLSYPAAYTNNRSGAAGEGTDILYHLSLNSTDAEADEAILLDDVSQYPGIKFRYLKLFHTLSYDKNAGNAAGTAAPQTETSDGEELTIAAADSFSRGGWHFTGWNTQADGEGTSYAPGAAIRLLDNKDVTLYAQWAPYSLSYDKNSEAADGAMNAAVPDGDESTVTVSGNRFTRSGWHFTGWNTQADGSGISVDAETVLTLDRDTVLYAQWEQDAQVLPEKPQTPETPEKITYEKKKTAVSSGSSSDAGSPKTGDAGAMPWILSLMLSAAGLFGLTRRKERK